ncbi:hypothetical protein CNMCM7691_002693 [Aspergillus felis]|uniref:Cytochrome b561 domain-containing protein n=1 Tax=Aspergillus felis TaxID=1287682 RepID=A0A8H6R0P1_9EURO|nr:hypothetical protein CNMCM7691_002693 [Aspergillus felis]
MYGDSFFPVFLSPPALLANLRMNHLRLQAFLHPSTESEGKALALLGRITAFPPEQWAMSEGDLGMQQYVDRQLSALETDIGAPLPLLATVVSRNSGRTLSIARVENARRIHIHSLASRPDSEELDLFRVFFGSSSDLISTSEESFISTMIDLAARGNLGGPGVKSPMLLSVYLHGGPVLSDLVNYNGEQGLFSISSILAKDRGALQRGYANGPLAAAQIYSFSPASDVVYSVIVPESTVSSNSGPIYFQIRAPTTYQWVALGQGSQMAGSNMFLMYAASANNVTLSPRSGRGHVPPGYNPDAQIDLLDGTGISNGYMTANVRCNNCLQWIGGSLDPSSTSSSWIWAEKKGPAIDSSDVSFGITLHDSHGVQTVNMAQARMAAVNASNPFAGVNAASTPQTATGGTTTSNTNSALIAHAALMSVAFVVLFPSFAISIHIIPYSKAVMRIHAPLQLFTLAMAIAGLGLGVYLGVDTNQMDKYHPIIGLVVVGLLVLFQPLMGLLQHMHFRRTDGKSVFAYIHRWLGRVLIALGIINGGLGFLLTKNSGKGASKGAIIAYSVVAGVVGLAYIIFVIVLPFRPKRSAAPQKEVSSNGSSEETGLQERNAVSN